MSASKRPADDLDPDDPVDAEIIDRQVKAARQAGRDRRDRAKTTRGRPELEDAYDEGAADEDDGQDDEDQDDEDEGRPRRQRARRSFQAASGYLSRGSWRPRSPTTPPSRMRDAGGLLTGMLLYTAVVTYLRYGPAGWKGWLSAKFLNKPMTAAAASTAAGTGSTTRSV
jgi:hypothetical protein